MPWKCLWNANTHVHGGVHLVVLAHLRRRWSLSGREGFGFISPSRRACEAWFGVFKGVKRLFSITPEVRKETEANGGHCGDRTLHRTRSRFDRIRPVSSQQLWGARVLGFATSVSSPSRNRSVRSGSQRGRAGRRADRTHGVSDHMQSNASGRGGSLLDSDRTPGAARPVKCWSASGHFPTSLV
jgi:hypothetical protein